MHQVFYGRAARFHRLSHHPEIPDRGFAQKEKGFGPDLVDVPHRFVFAQADIQGGGDGTDFKAGVHQRHVFRQQYELRCHPIPVLNTHVQQFEREIID